MDDRVPQTPGPALWLAWATAVLLAIGLGSAAVMNVRNNRPDQATVSAAGRASAAVDVPTATTRVPDPPPVTAAPPPTLARSTTVPKAAAAVLAAIASTTTPAIQPPQATTTTQTIGPPVTSTTATTATTAATAPTAPPPTTSTSTTSTTIPRPASVTIANNVGYAVSVKLNGTVVEVQPKTKAAPVDVSPDPKGNDTVAARAVSDDRCTGLATGGPFRAGSRYQLTITAGDTPCPPVLELTPIP